MSVDEPTLTVARLGRLLENTTDVELSLPQYRVLGLLSTGDERAPPSSPPGSRSPSRR